MKIDFYVQKLCSPAKFLRGEFLITFELTSVPARNDHRLHTEPVADKQTMKFRRRAPYKELMQTLHTGLKRQLLLLKI